MSTYAMESKESLLRKYSAILFFTIICYGAIYLILFGAIKIAIVCGISATLGLFAPVIYKYSRSISLAVKFLIFSSIIIIIFTAIYTGGPKSPVLFWLTTVPLIGSFLSNKQRTGLWWSSVSLFSFLTVIIHKHIFGLFDSEVASDYEIYVHSLAFLGISLINGIASRLFQDESQRNGKKSQNLKES